jgi:tripartite-type tricarboxylate transporter receptor subunit TctC
MMAGVNLLPVHYRGGGPALADLLGGRSSDV